MKKTYQLTHGAQPLGRYPHARRVGNLLFVSGTSSRRPDNTHEGVTILEDGRVEKDIALQTAATIRNVEKILAMAGLGLQHVVDVTTFLVEMSDFSAYNKVYNDFFSAEDGPTRTTVAVSELPHPNLLIELKVIAEFPEGHP